MLRVLEKKKMMDATCSNQEKNIDAARILQSSSLDIIAKKGIWVGQIRRSGCLWCWSKVSSFWRWPSLDFEGLWIAPEDLSVSGFNNQFACLLF